MKRFLYYFVQFTWGIIQNIFGLILYLAHSKSEHINYFGSVCTMHNKEWGGISLGIFIFVNGTKDKDWIEETKVHEYGHSIQSLILGPLYLFVIGFPSMIWCNSKKYQKLRKEKNINYVDFYPEKWANHLGEKITHLKAPLR